jgi:segregation and condensation protein A
MIETPGEARPDVSHDGDSDPDGSADGDDEEVEPVELLVQLAEDGEIDPWDIDIVEVTDAFLDELEERDLRTSGRALFYASVLLRMKSDAMLEADEPEDDQPEPWETAFRDDPDPDGGPDDEFDPVDALEEEMDRRLERKSTTTRLGQVVSDRRDHRRSSIAARARCVPTTNPARAT